MNENANIEIEIKYKRKGESEFKSITLSPIEYFDLDVNESVYIDSVPKYDHAIEYIENSVDITSTILRIKEGSIGPEINITETFWNNQKNRVIERNDIGFGEPYNEIILVTTIQESPLITENTRIIRRNGILIPILHEFLSRNEDESEDVSTVLLLTSKDLDGSI